MDGEQRIPKNKAVAKTVGFGILSVSLYAAVFTNADTVMHYFTKGGVYAALPIVTVFIFSFAHGAFASSFWSLLGINAIQKDAQRQTVRKTTAQKKQARKRPRMHAYVNPFHKI